MGQVEQKLQERWHHYRQDLRAEQLGHQPHVCGDDPHGCSCFRDHYIRKRIDRNILGTQDIHIQIPNNGRNEDGHKNRGTSMLDRLQAQPEQGWLGRELRPEKKLKYNSKYNRFI